MYIGQPIVVFRADKKTSTDPDETFKGSLLNFDQLYSWVQEKCIPLVREITFENAEELTEEGLPFLILFHHPTDNHSVKRFKEIISKELEDDKRNYFSFIYTFYISYITLCTFTFLEKEFIKSYIIFTEKINFLTADGVRFEHPLHHLGKSVSDLPLIAIDSFRHMYLFPNYSDMEVPGKLKQFLQDLYSGKLHR